MAVKIGVKVVLALDAFLEQILNLALQRREDGHGCGGESLESVPVD